MPCPHRRAWRLIKVGRASPHSPPVGSVDTQAVDDGLARKIKVNCHVSACFRAAATVEMATRRVLCTRLRVIPNRRAILPGGTW